ncbi:MAG: 4Fe-4S binding protein [Pseudomonadota bacterium]
MAYVIDKEKCNNCGDCEPACPVEAITEKDAKRLIDADLCTDCGVCADECPDDAISEE